MKTYTLKDLLQMGVFTALTGMRSYPSIQRYFRQKVKSGELKVNKVGHYYAITKDEWNNFVQIIADNAKIK